MRYEPTPAESFTKNLIGFIVFIGLSISLTIAVNAYMTQQVAQQQAAAASAQLLATN